MFIRRGHKSNGTVKVAMIIPRKETQTIGLSCLKGLKSTRIGRMALQGREEGFNKRVIRGGTGSCKVAQHMDGFPASDPRASTSSCCPGHLRSEAVVLLGDPEYVGNQLPL